MVAVRSSPAKNKVGEAPLIYECAIKLFIVHALVLRMPLQGLFYLGLL
jgi:hypothetical protein